MWLHRAKTLLRDIVYMCVSVCVSMSQCFFRTPTKKTMLYIYIYIHIEMLAMDVEKSHFQPADRRNNSCEKSQRRERIRRERVREESQQERRSQQQSVREGRKVRNTVFFPSFVAPEARKAGSLKRRTQSHLVARHCGAKRTSASQRLLGSQLLNKVRASVARSRFPSPNAKNTSASQHPLEIELSKKRQATAKHARGCGAKQISKWNCQKHTRFGPLLDVQASFSWQAHGILHLAKNELNM